MAIKDFTLKSGADLKVDIASFEIAITLVEAIKRAMRGTNADKDAEVGDAVASDPEVRRAIMAAGRWALYRTRPVEPALFDDPQLGLQARGDYFEIARRIIEVNTFPFFPQTSSASTAPGEETTRGQA